MQDSLDIVRRLSLAIQFYPSFPVPCAVTSSSVPPTTTITALVRGHQYGARTDLIGNITRFIIDDFE